ncbi:hypothetical protein SSX86_027363 [Deinandra increscens subsp. villosa]|uniref:BHLH domain-containing protein n=1 Tax=Deinandra increscens subsp. villosa TaxID=3103831 RepID=A0AAP0CN04_9ASTR
MNYQRVPSWDLEDVNPNHAIFKLDYEVAELTWENGQLTLHELGTRRVPTKSQPTTSWDQPRTAETLEALVSQATHQLPDVAVGVAGLNESAAMATSDALVPASSKNRNGQAPQRSAKSAGCSTRVASCSGYPSAFMDPTVARGGGGVTVEAVAAGDLGGQRLTSTSTENTSSGRDYSNADNQACHRRTQRETKAVKEKKKEKAKSSTLISKRRRTAALHNQSERQRRDKINQKLKTLQMMVPNSSKTDKSSMLDEVIEYIKQLQSQVNGANTMSMSPMMTSFVMQQQQQQQLHNCLMNSLGMGMRMGMNISGPYNIPPSFHPSAFMNTPYWNNHSTDQVINANTMAGGPMPAFLAPESQPPNMDSYSKMTTLYQQMQNQPGGPFPKK